MSSIVKGRTYLIKNSDKLLYSVVLNGVVVGFAFANSNDTFSKGSESYNAISASLRSFMSQEYIFIGLRDGVALGLTGDLANRVVGSLNCVVEKSYKNRSKDYVVLDVIDSNIIVRCLCIGNELFSTWRLIQQ